MMRIQYPFRMQCRWCTVFYNNGNICLWFIQFRKINRRTISNTLHKSTLLSKTCYTFRLLHNAIFSLKGEGKAIPVQPWTGLEGSRSLGLIDVKTIGTRRWFSPKHRPSLTPSKYFCFSFLLEAESTPGP